MGKSSKRAAASGAVVNWTASEIVLRAIDDIHPYPNNPKQHPQEQIEQLAALIKEFGFDQPIVVDEDLMILKGHGRQMAARLLGLTQVPTIQRIGLTPAQKKAIIIADNQVPLLGSWNDALLKIEVGELKKLNYDLKLLGFPDLKLVEFVTGAVVPKSEPNEIPPIEEALVSQLGDVWVMGKHTLHCADSTKAKTSIEDVRLQLTDPPYELETEGGGIQRKRTYPKKIQQAGIDQFDVVGLVQMARTNVFFTSKLLLPDYMAMAKKLEQPWDLAVLHRLAAMPNTATHLMTDLDYIVLIGDMKPNRGLEYADYSKMLSLPHWDRPVPWAKPIEILTKFIKLYTAAGETVYDPYCGSGSTIIACEANARICVGVEIAPVFVDVAVRRWQKFTGQKAVLSGSKKTFDQVAKERTKKKAA